MLSVKSNVLTESQTKEMYHEFCRQNYVPIYSQPWWMDAVCEEKNWDVWLYEKNGCILAAMPYYLEWRGDYKYITRPPLTQNNGILFHEDQTRKACREAEFQENIINAANDFIESMKLDVYEQQYQYSFQNWLPFYWNGYTAVTRYTYVIETTVGLDEIWKNVSANYRNKIKKGWRNGIIAEGLDKDIFWMNHRKIFDKQGLECPFSMELWNRLYKVSVEQKKNGKIFYAHDEEGNVLSVLFLVWDKYSVYQLLGGSMPEYQNFETYDSLIWEGIKYAYNMGLKYDFEGSVIKRVSKSMREFGGKPMPYFRIRKVFNPKIFRSEAEAYIESNLCSCRKARSERL